MLDFARNAKGDIKTGLEKLRMKMHDLASNIGEVENTPLDISPQLLLLTGFTPAENIIELKADSQESNLDGEEESNKESNEQFSNSYWAPDIDCWERQEPHISC